MWNQLSIALTVVAIITTNAVAQQTHLSHLEALRTLRTSEAEIEGLLLSGRLAQR